MAFERDQYENMMDINPGWSASGGTISDEGLFSSYTEGEFTITISAGTCQAEAVVKVISRIESLGNSIMENNLIYPNPVGSELHFLSIRNRVIRAVTVYNTLGELIISRTYNNDTAVDLNIITLQKGICTASIRLENGMYSLFFV